MTHEIVTITDADTGSTARLVPAVGFNCFAFHICDSGGVVNLLWSEPGFEQGDRRASGSGVPILFPFPGRIAGTTLIWDGRRYELEAGDGIGNAIHGFVHERAWRVVEQGPARVTGQFQASIDDPSLLDCWPADFRVTATYEVSGSRLAATYLVENPDHRALPCGLGTHPYFRLPLGGASADVCVVRLPVSSSWELESMNTTGRKFPLENPQQFQQGQPFGQLVLDTVFSDLVSTGGWCRAEILDPDTCRTGVLGFDRAFHECVVYTPPHREAICVEPYTCAPDPFRLEREGVMAGLRVLREGESFRARMEISLELA
jgi:aldose 1-epimerase